MYVLFRPSEKKVTNPQDESAAAMHGETKVANPPKNAAANASNDLPDASSWYPVSMPALEVLANLATATKRPRGRPRKHPLTSPLSASVNADGGTGKKRGRPPKNRDPSQAGLQALSVGTGLKRGRGRPKKILEKNVPEGNEVEGREKEEEEEEEEGWASAFAKKQKGQVKKNLHKGMPDPDLSELPRLDNEALLMKLGEIDARSKVGREIKRLLGMRVVGGDPADDDNRGGMVEAAAAPHPPPASINWVEAATAPHPPPASINWVEAVAAPHPPPASAKRPRGRPRKVVQSNPPPGPSSVAPKNSHPAPESVSASVLNGDLDGLRREVKRLRKENAMLAAENLRVKAQLAKIAALASGHVTN